MLQEPAPFSGADFWPADRRLTAPLGAQRTLQESAPFPTAADSWLACLRLRLRLGTRNPVA